MADDTQWWLLQPVRLTLTMTKRPVLPTTTMPMNPRRDKYWLLAALAFGLLVLPLLVHMTGRYLLGKYAGGGGAAFMGDFLMGLVTLRWYSWVLALGPVVIVALWLLLARLMPTSRG
jgi:hypothetical protein